MNILRITTLLLTASLMSGCSWWFGDEEILPADLTSFKEEVKVKNLWSSKVGSGLGDNYHEFRPAILSDRIYVCDSEGTIEALDLNTGKVIWSVDTEVVLSSGVGVGDGKVLVTSNDGRLLAFKALDGEPLWTTLLSSESVVPPQVNGKVVLVQTIDGRLTGFEPSSGEQLWFYSAQIPALSLRGTSTPILTDEAAFAGFSNGKVVALNSVSGEVAWEARAAIPEGKTELERMVDVDGELLLSGNQLYVSSYQGRLVAIAANNGRIYWNKPLSSFQGVAENISQLFASDAEGNVRAFEKSNGLEYWKQEGLFYRQSTAPIVLKNTVAVADYQGYVHFMSPQDGRFVAREQVDSSGVRGPLLVQDDVLYVYGNSGRLTALTLDK
ncbi:MAG: outer membrane protein assembly factor BamB [Motiliproteus sp.]